MKKRILSVLMILALLVAALIVTAQAADPDPDGNGCPHCTGTVTWTQWSGTAGAIADEGHYKLTAKAKVSSYLDVNNKDIVIDVNGFNLYNDPGPNGRGATTRVLRVSNGGTVTVIDSSGTNTGAISGSATSNGSAVFINSGTVNLYGGIIKCNSTSYSNEAGGTVYVNGSGILNVYGGEIRATTLTGATGSGGAIYTASAGSQVNISGGKITGGTVGNTGTAIFTNGLLKISGNANISGNDNRTVYAKKEVILEGEPTVSGLSVTSDCSVKVNALTEGAKIGLVTTPVVLSEANPNLKSYVEAGYLYAYDASLALSVAEDNKTISGVAAVIDCPHCDTDPAEIQWVEWAKQTESGHYYIAQGTTTTQYVTAADTDIVLDLRGNWYTAGSNRAFVVKSGATFSLINTDDTLSVVSGGHSSGPVEVQADSTFNLYPNITCKQTTGSANTMAITAKGGTVVFAEGVDMTALNGKILNAGGKLEGVEGALLMDQQTVNGGVWYQTAQEAADLFVDADHDFVRLMGEATIKATQPGLFININGHDLTVDPESTVPVKVANMKSTVTAVDPATVTADEGDIQLVTPYTAKVQYVALPNGEGAYTVHRLELQLSYVTFRPAAFGFYYKANFNTDDVLASKIDAYGVALSLNGVPDTSVSTKTEMTDFAGIRGTDVKFGGLFGIMKQDNSAAVNAENAMMKVYANCYVKIGDLVILSDNSNVGKKAGDEGFSGVGKSLFDVMQALNDMTLEGEQLEAVNEFKAAMEGEMGVKWPEAGDTTLNTIS